MEWIIGGLIVLLVVFFIIMLLLLSAVDSRDSVIDNITSEQSRLISKYEHILTQIGREGFIVKTSYAQQCYVELKKDNT